ncbi:MAG: UDP-N-acetylmuramate--L-alanine ligase [Miltoncostaeaceae bacterium]
MAAAAPPPVTPRPIHLVGVGGAGMSGLARLAARAGYRVSGTDRDDGPALAALRAEGVDARAGHAADAVPADVEAVVVSTAIPDDNPDVVEARRRGVALLHRADLLAELMTRRRGLAVAGAHGKSTTSAMLALALGDASACIGATTDAGAGTGASWGEGEWFVAEADESDRSLLRLAPEAAIVTNVDHDHHASFATIESVEEVFRAFLAALPPGGVYVAGPDERAWALVESAPCPSIRVGPGGDLWVETRATGPAVVGSDGDSAPLSLSVPGDHNRNNAACALALARWCGVPLGDAAARLASFRGVGRRFEEGGSAGGVRIVDDYAHHPSELRATLAAAREGHPGRIVAVFQPHLFSRTQALSHELGAALAAADHAVVTEIYPAREDPIRGVSGRLVAEAVPTGTDVVFAPTLAAAAEAVVAVAREGDLVITLGAGDVTTLGKELLARLGNESGHGANDREQRPTTP